MGADGSREISSGGFVPWDELAGWFDRAKDNEFAGLEPLVTADRYAALLDGARLSPEEKHGAIRYELESYFDEPLEGWMYQLFGVDDSAGRRVVASAIVKGSSWEGLIRVFIGIHCSQDDAVADLKRYGLIDAQDLGEVLPRTRRLTEAQLSARTINTEGYGPV